MSSRINKVEGLDTNGMGYEVVLDDDEERRFLDDLGSPSGEELFDSLLPPVNHVEIPDVSRRRAHTVDAARTTPRSASESVLVVHRNFRKDDDDSSLDWSTCIDGEDNDEDEDDAAVKKIPATPKKDRCAAQNKRAPRLTLSQEDRLRRRQRLLNSRCMRGFLLLCVYAGLVLQPSLTNRAPTATLEPLDSPTALSATAVNHTSPAGKTRSPLADLPRFHHRTTPYHSTIPPNSTNVHWHKIPPTPPQVYHKKLRPILSHAHSYQLHQEPLVFGRELKTSFLVDSSDFDRAGITMIVPSRFSWGTSLIWLSLLCLLCDTSYREWQHYRWHRQYHRRSASQRSLHHRRRSPSPVPPSNSNSRRFRQQQQLRRPSRPRFDSF